MALKDLLTSSSPNYCKLLLSGRNVCFRPMIVGEEKSLLLAKQTEDKKTILKNLINVLSACCSDENIKNIKNISISEFENLFLLLRSKSIGETESFLIKCPETEEEVQIKINLESDIKITVNTPNDIIKINDNLVIIMQEPTIHALFKYPDYDKDSEELFGFIGCCIKKIQTNKETINCEDMPEQEVLEFVKNLNKKQFNEIIEYLNNTSKTYIIANYTTKDGIARQIKINGLFNYFSFFLTI